MSDWQTEGYLTIDDLREKGNVPPEERLRRSPVAMTECIQEIPCNPCKAACPFDAIVMETITTPPRVDFDKCTGCTMCMRVCPGLTIFMVYLKRKGDTDVGEITIPYELLPVPARGSVVEAVNRSGEVVGEAVVTRVFPPEKNSGTALVTIEVPGELLMEVRSIGRVLRSPEVSP